MKILKKDYYKIYRNILFLFFVMVLSISSYANYDPDLDWKVLESDYFKIIFPANGSSSHPINYQDIAYQVAYIADEIHQSIRPEFGEAFKPNQKIVIILEDFSDSVYGFATVLPHPLIRINLTAPGFKTFDPKFESWIRIVIAHEYAHLAHFDMTSKATKFLRFFLGQVIAPNALQPVWAIEGLAIFQESKWNVGGRLEDNRYQMYLRADFESNQTKKLDQIQGSYLVSWPGGNAPYIYGQSLIHFIANRYGEDALINISKEFCATPYLGMNRSLKKVIGIDQNQLLELWEKDLKVIYQKQIEELKKITPLTSSQQITKHHYWVDAPEWLLTENNGKSDLIYKVFTSKSFPTIRQYDLENKDEKILIERTTGHDASYSLSPDSQFLLYPKLRQFQDYYSFYDLFLCQIETGRQIRITDGMRIKDPSWHPSDPDNRIAAVTNRAGTNQLVLFSLSPFLENDFQQKSDNLLTDSDLKELTFFQPGTQISHPVWSPDGSQIAFSLWQEGHQDIGILSLDMDWNPISFQKITSDPYVDISPYWSPDGKMLYFSSDRNEIYNLYAYHLEEQKLYLLTNVTTGAFEPAISPDGNQVAFIQYHSTGYELHLVDITDLLWKQIEFKTTDLINDSDSLVQISHLNQKPVPYFPYKIKNYSPWESLFPTYWIPYLNITKNDLYIGGESIAQDYLKFYSIPFTVARGLLTGNIFYQVKMQDYSRNPSFSLSVKGETNLNMTFATELNFSHNGYTSRDDSGRYFRQDLILGFQSQTEKQKKEEQEVLDQTKRTHSLFLKLNYDNSEEYPASISPEIGQKLSFSYQFANQVIGSDQDFQKILFDGRSYFPLPVQNQVLALRFAAGVLWDASEESEQFNLGGNSSSAMLTSLDTDSFPLRGFPRSSFQGNYVLISSLEYRFPIMTIERKVGFDWASIFLERISGALFLDTGNIWESLPAGLFENWKVSAGAEIHFKFNQKHNNPFILTLGMGKSLTDHSPFRLHAQIGISF